MPEGTSVGQINLHLNVNKNQFNKQMKGITKTAKDASTSMTNSFSGAFKKLAVVAASAFALKKIVAFGKECISLGSDLAEVQNVVDATFTSMSSQVDAFAKNAAAKFGLSETMAKKFTGTFGAMSRAFGFSEKQAYGMSTALTGLSGDVASFYNISQDEAYTKLKSIFTGETETLKDLGVVMTQNALDAYAMANGYGKVTAKMSEAEKVALRFAFVQDKLSASTGDFVRTSDSWANQVRVLKLNFDSLRATIGQGLINVFTPVLKVINIVLAKLQTVAAAFKALTEMLFGKQQSSSGGGITEIASSTASAEDSSTGFEQNLGGAAKSAEKIRKSIMGFDQIAKLDDTSATTGGSSISDIDFPGSDLSSFDQAADSVIERAKRMFADFFKPFETEIEHIVANTQSAFGKLQNFVDTTVKPGLGSVWSSMEENFGPVIESTALNFLTFVEDISANFNGFLDSVLPNAEIAFESFTTYLSETCVPEVARNFDTIQNSFFKVAGKLQGLFFQVGEDLVNSIAERLPKFLETLGEFQGSVGATFRKCLNVASSIVSSGLEQLKKSWDTYGKDTIGRILDFFLDIWEIARNCWEKKIKPVIDEVCDMLNKLWYEHLSPLLDKVVQFVAKVIETASNLWNNYLKPLVKWLQDTFAPVFNAVFSAVSGYVGEHLGNVMDELGNLLGILTEIVDFVNNVFVGDWAAAWENVENIFQGVWDGLVMQLQNPVNEIISGINGLIKGLNKIKLPSWVPFGLGGKSINIPLIPEWTPNINVGSGFGGGGASSGAGRYTTRSGAGRYTTPRLAEGGFIRANTPQLALIGDNRHEGEIVAPESKMLEMAKMAAGMGNSEIVALLKQLISVMQNQQLSVYMDSDLVSKKVANGINEITAKSGRCPVIV